MCLLVAAGGLLMIRPEQGRRLAVTFIALVVFGPTVLCLLSKAIDLGLVLAVVLLAGAALALPAVVRGLLPGLGALRRRRERLSTRRERLRSTMRAKVDLPPSALEPPPRMQLEDDSALGAEDPSDAEDLRARWLE